MYTYIKLFICTLLVASGLLTTSCIKTEMTTTQLSTGNAISGVTYQYNWYDTTNAGTANQTINYHQSTLNNTVVVSNDTVYCSPSLPSNFSIDQIPNVSLKNLWAYATISSQAVIVPVGNAPVLGNAGDYSVPRSYTVTAASGATKSYVIVTASIPVLKINKYQGTYTETGYFTHPTSPRALNATKVLSYIDPNTVSCDMADLGGSGYTLNIKVNSDNSCAVTEFLSGNVLANSQMVSGATNQYYPASKTFILNYEYLGSGGWRIITDTLRKQ